MTREEFEQLAGAGVILLDGATGSNLTKAGMPKGVSTELWVLEHPDILVNLQKAYVEAGSQIVYAPTFGANRLKLADYGRENEVEELNARLVDISKKALAGTGALIAGDFSTPGKMLQPKGDLSYEELLESYTEQVTAVANAGVDLLVAETMLSVDETCVFMDAALSVCDLPIMCSLTLEADGSALFGGNAVEAVETLQEMGASAVGLNCSVGPDQLEAVVNSMKKVARVPVIVKPNAGLPKIMPTGEAIYSMDAPTFAKYMNILVDAGAGIVGGCCGTTPEHIHKTKYAKRFNPRRKTKVVAYKPEDGRRRRAYQEASAYHNAHSRGPKAHRCNIEDRREYARIADSLEESVHKKARNTFFEVSGICHDNKKRRDARKAYHVKRKSYVFKFCKKPVAYGTAGYHADEGSGVNPYYRMESRFGKIHAESFVKVGWNPRFKAYVYVNQRSENYGQQQKRGAPKNDRKGL